MPNCKFFDAPSGRRLAYHRVEGEKPGVVFLGGFKSDMEGSKAVFLQEMAENQGRAFLRFDYSGHGQSSGEFTEGCIGDWAQDAMEIVSALTYGPQVIIGSSMGGWVAFLLAREMPERFQALIGIAAAPDFTEDSIWAGLSEAQRATLMKQGQIELPSEYADSPYVFTRHLIEDGRKQLVLNSPLSLPFPVRLLQGTADASVKRSVPLRIVEHATGADIRLTLMKGADHSFSTPECLALIGATLAALPR
ncbi:MAG: alpha/beta fold hydrolase [Rhodobacteraceae bacterium]|nr:alpha/beta fold hydrolase [Paracoccaceae bacterium]